MNQIKIVSIIPYKILPAKLGGEKGIALFNEYVGQNVELTGISTRNNEIQFAKNYTLLNIITNNRIRYINPFLFFTVKRIIRQTRATHLITEHPYFGWLAFLLKRAVQLKWIVHSHNIEYMRSRSIGRWWWKALMMYEKWVYKNADLNFFISEDDRQFALENLGIDPARSFSITYGIEQENIPDDIPSSREKIKALYKLQDDETILLFNGALYHHTNYDAVTVILNEINPLLEKEIGLKYKIIICGKGLPESFHELKDFRDRNIIFAGFVDDISLYFKAADIFLNPIISGGGIKTKAVEALANNCTVISTEIGALGIKRDVCDNKILVSKNGDWKTFTGNLISAFNTNNSIPSSFFEYYYWGNIANRVVSILKGTYA